MEAYAKDITYKKRVTIIPIGDIHLGSPSCDVSKLNRTIEWILNRQDTYVIGMGDYADLITRTDLKRFMGDVTSDELRDTLDSAINEQRRKVVEKFKPLAEAGRILGLMEGNHEYNLKKYHQYDIMKDICEFLRVPYLGYSFLYRLTIRPDTNGINKRTCVIYGHHGHGGGRKKGASMNRLVDLIANYDFDIGLMGHDHHKMGTREIRFGITHRGKPQIIQKPIVLCRTGTFHKTFVDNSISYSEKAGYPPRDTGVVRIDIRTKGKNHDLDIHISE